MKKIKILNRYDDSILYEYKCDDNTIKKTLIKAVKTGADLREADLTGAYLRGAYLRGADLGGADLGGADLRGADLRGAYLRGADLTGADLTGADLRGADLRGAYLRGAYLRGADNKKIVIKKAQVFTGIYKYICIPVIDENDIEYIRLGCYFRTVKEWEQDFWNNEKEFPNNDSIESELRKLAHKTCKKWLKLNR